MFMVGRYLDKSSPTIVVMVQPRASHQWTGLIASIKSLVRSKNLLKLEIDIEIVPGDVFTTTTDPATETILNRDERKGSFGMDFTETMRADGAPEMGTSIGIEGEQGGGTLGGFVTFTHGNMTRTCGITNYHVVRPARDASEDILQKANVFGSSPGESDHIQSNIIYYTPRDVRATRDKLEEHEVTAARCDLKGKAIPATLHQSIEYCRSKFNELKSKHLYAIALWKGILL